MPPANVFTCRRCGQCCQGIGGIVLAARDIERLCRHLGLDRETLLSRYAEQVADRPRLVSRKDGYCVFYQGGCGIYEARPDVCRAWPFFQANLVDPGSFAMAREDCLGIDRETSHEEFASQGKAFLERQGLMNRNGDDGPRALVGCTEEHSREKDHGRPGLDAA